MNTYIYIYRIYIYIEYIYIYTIHTYLRYLTSHNFIALRFDFVVYVYIDIYSTCIVLKQEKEVEDLSLLFATGQDDLRGFQHIFFESSSIYIYIFIE